MFCNQCGQALAAEAAAYTTCGNTIERPETSEGEDRERALRVTFDSSGADHHSPPSSHAVCSATIVA